MAPKLSPLTRARVVEMQSLLSRTSVMLKARTISLLDIHHRTGLPYHWLIKMRDGAIDNPSVNRIQVLYEFLADKKLDV